MFDNHDNLSTEEKIKFWEKMFSETMEQIVSIGVEANKNADTDSIRFNYILGKLATLTVASAELGSRIKKLESKENKDI